VGVTITLIRHGETAANHGHIWQGQGDSALTAAGREQAAALGRRFEGADPGLVVASNLGRTLATAGFAGLDAEADPEWREMDIGAWEGMTRTEVLERYPEELAALRRGEPVRMGGGETWSEFGGRIARAFDALVGRLADGEHATVVTHGGVIHSVVSAVLTHGGRGRPWPMDRVRNTALAVVSADHRGRRLVTYNDDRHARTAPHPDETGPIVTLVRHGESEANLDGRWQGRTDGALTERGLLQGAELAALLDGATHVYSSPLRRAADTARAFAAVAGLEVATVDDLVEIDFGAWEDMTPSDARRADPDLWHRVYDHGEDLPRGRTGERYADAAVRIERAVVAAAAGGPDRHPVLFTHGGALRAFLASIVGLDHAHRRRLTMPGNASASRVRLSDAGAVVTSFNVGGGRPAVA